MIVAYIREGQHLAAQGHEAAANDKFSIAFEVLVRHYQRAVVGFCVHMLRGAVDRVEDIAQEVFLAVWKTMTQFRHEASIRTWVFAIARHHCWDVLRQMGPHDVADGSGRGARRETPDPVPSPDEQYTQAQERAENVKRYLV